MNTRIIGMIGTHCTGKTTVVMKLADKFEDDGYKVLVIKKTARNFKKEELGMFETQTKITSLLIEKIFNGIGKYDIILTDRTPLDNLGYTLFYMIDRNWDPEMVDDVIDEMHRCITLTNMLYDMIILADNRNKIQVVDDGFRFTDTRSRNYLDVLVKTLIKTYTGTLVRWDISMDYNNLYYHIKFNI